MARSTKTLEDYRYDAEDLLGLDHDDNDLEDNTIILGSNSYMNFYRSLEVTGLPEHNLSAITSVTMTSSGSDLSAITDIYDIKNSFKVWLNPTNDTDQAMVDRNRLMPVRKGQNTWGYYLEGGVLLVNPDLASQTLDIVYQYAKAITKTAIGATLSDITPDIDAAFEDMITLYIMYRYYFKGGDNPDAATDALNDARNLTLENFNLKRRVIGI